MNLAAAYIPAFALQISKATASTKNFALPANLSTMLLVNNVLDNDGDFAKIVGGHWYDAWLEGTKEVLKIQGVKAKEKQMW